MKTILRELIDSLPGDCWDAKVGECARILERSRSTVYQWLCDSPPISTTTLDALRYRISCSDS